MSYIPSISKSKTAPVVEAVEQETRVPLLDMEPLERAAHLTGTDIFGLKCDTPSCSWSDMDIPLDAYALYLGAHCPECGANVLTAQDFQMAMTAVFAFAAGKYSEDNGLNFPAVLTKKERMH